MSRKVYLAGAMEFAHDGGRDWRAEMTAWLAAHLGHATLDPTVLEHDQLSDEERALIPQLRAAGKFAAVRELAHRIVHYDAGLVLNEADYLVVLWDDSTQRGCGTAGEITLAAWAGKPVHLLLDYPRERASTWMIGCCTTIHESWEDLRGELLRRYGREVTPQ